MTLLLVMFITLSVFSGCQNFRRFFYDFDELKATVERIDIVYVRPDDSIEFIKTVEGEEMQEVLCRLSKFEFFYHGGIPITIAEAIRLFYTNGNIEIIGEGAHRIYDNTGAQIGGGGRAVVEVREWRAWINSFRE